MLLLTACGPRGVIDIHLAPEILQEARVNTPYSQKFVATGGLKPYYFRGPCQGLPPGMVFAQVTSTEALLEGTPQQAGEYVFQISVCDSQGKCVTRAYLLKVLPAD